MKNTIATLTLAIVMTLGTSFAFAGDGIIVAGKGGNPCSSSKDGIIVAGRDGIIVAGRDGILVSDLVGIFTTIFTDNTPVECTAGRDGILVSD